MSASLSDRLLAAGRAGGDPDARTQAVLDALAAYVWAGAGHPPPTPAHLRPTVPQLVERIGPTSVGAILYDHLAWLDLPAAARPPHPAGQLVRSFLGGALVRLEQRTDGRRILPIVRGMTTGGLGASQLLDLPLFRPPPSDPLSSVPLLDLRGPDGRPVVSRGRGAPLPARLVVRCAVSVQPTDRTGGEIQIIQSVRQLAAALFPSGWDGRRDWPRLREALIDCHRYWLTDSGGGQWFPLLLRRLPAERGTGLPRLDDYVILSIAFPATAPSGPAVSVVELDRLAASSASRWRAYVAGHTLTWQPGRTRRPLGRMPSIWAWSRNPDDYPLLSARQRRALAFGTDDRKHRTAAEIDGAWTGLHGLASVAERQDRRGRRVAWRLIPIDAHDALRAAEMRSTGENILSTGENMPATGETKRRKSRKSNRNAVSRISKYE